MRPIMGKVGAYQPFRLGCEAIRELAGVTVTEKEIGKEAEEFLRKEETREQSAENREANNVM